MKNPNFHFKPAIPLKALINSNTPNRFINSLRSQL